MLPKFVDAPYSPTLNIVILLFTLDIIYIHHSLAFGIRTAKAAAKENRVFRSTQHKCTDSLTAPQLWQFYVGLATRMLNWSHETGRKLHRLVTVSWDQ